MKNILFIGDGVVSTGFSRVVHSIIENLPEDEFNCSHLAINYFGDPHPYKHKIYPAATKGDLYGLNRLPEVLETEKPDCIFILNDVWVIQMYLDALKKIYKDLTIPKIVCYFPIDAEDHDHDWYEHFDIVTQPVVYTKFGYNVAKKAAPEYEYKIIQHGVDSKCFYKIDEDKKEIKRKLFKRDDEDFVNSFIVLNCSRNQPRKRLDITMEAFSLFAEGKPDNVKLYMHCGIKDASMDVVKLAVRYGINKRLIITNTNMGVQNVPIEKLNLIYNATDVGINTCLGEGWSLTNIEHAVTGAPQVVSDNSALHELYDDCGLLVPTVTKWTMDHIMTTGSVVKPEDVAKKLELLYSDKDLYQDLSRKSVTKFTDEKYTWKYIGKLWTDVFKEVIDGDNMA